MSTSSARRVKERAAVAAGKITPSVGKSISAGKENPRPASRGRAAMQKPAARPVARVDKSAVEESRADPRVRKSTSSVPRGRSSSPSEFTRILSDSRNNSRFSLGPPQKKVNSANSNEQSGGRYNLRNRVSKDLEKNDKIDIPLVKNGVDQKKEGDLSSIPVLNSNIEEKVLKSFEKNDKSLDELEGNYENFLKTLDLRSSGVGIGSSSRDSKMASKMTTSKYPSKLHEKLAFLEGKLKRIASEIKKTKEMLDINNSDASKMILSTIQEKISGIEKAMGVVEHDDDDAKMLSVESDEDDEKENGKDLMDTKSSIKGLNVEELEGRLFPHDKLIRDRKISNTAFNADKGNVVISFDASLSKKETKVVPEFKEVDDVLISAEESPSMNVVSRNGGMDSLLMADENLDEFDDDQKRVPTMMSENEVEERCTYQLNDIGGKSSTGGWFVSEGESVLLAHDDGSCSFYDIANSEEKAVYKPPTGIPPNAWRDCWLIRAPSADGCSGKYIIAASAGNSLNSGFCSWDFYTKDIRAFHFEDGTAPVRTALAPLSNNTMYNRRNSMATENRQWWYKPCGPLIVSTASCQKMVQIYDIRDGDRVMKWELQKPVLGMEYAGPLHWRNRGKVVVAETEGVSLWDVSSLVSQALVSVSSPGGKISALHVNNSDAEIGGGVRQRISSSEAEGNDGVFCTSDSINILDFRQPSGIALKIPKVGVNAQSSFSCGDSIYIGCTNSNPSVKRQSSSQIQQFSLRKQRLLTTYPLPESNAHHHFTALTQVWGNSSRVMGVCGLGLFVFDSLKDDGLPSLSMDSRNVREIIGPDDMYSPSFDYLGSRVLLISRDRPACWRYLF